MAHLASQFERRAHQFWFGCRTAIAIVLAIGIALAMDWQRPEWAGIAVMSISQDSGSATLGKGKLRLAATAAAAVCALTMIALFPQDRWLFFLSLSLYVGVCGYHMLGSRHAYAWRVAAYVCPVIAISAGSVDGANNFMTALERLLENLVGISSITLVALITAPRTNRLQFKQYIDNLNHQVPEIITSARSYWFAKDRDSQWQELRGLLSSFHSKLSHFEQVLQPAMDEDAATSLNRSRWRAVHQAFINISDDLATWCVSLRQLSKSRAARGVDIHLERADLALKSFSKPPSIATKSSANEMQTVAHQNFDDNSIHQDLSVADPLVCLAESQLNRIYQKVNGVDRLLAELNQDPRTLSKHSGSRGFSFSLDLDRLRVGIRLAAGIWIAALAWIFVPDLPGGASVIVLTAVFSAILALAGMRSQELLPSVLKSLVPAGFLYVFVLPHLEGFLQLALLLFGYVVLVFVLADKQASMRTLCVDFLLITFGITNQQSYSFIGFINRSIAIVTACVIIALLQEIPWSSRPEFQLNDYLSRFRRAFIGMMTITLRPLYARSGMQIFWRKIITSFYLRELSTLSVAIDNISRKVNASDSRYSKGEIDVIREESFALNHFMAEFYRLLSGVLTPGYSHRVRDEYLINVPACESKRGLLTASELAHCLNMIASIAMHEDPILAKVAQTLKDAWERLPDPNRRDSNELATIC